MTLVLHLEPTIARDFSLMIQSCGRGFGIQMIKLSRDGRLFVYYCLHACQVGVAFNLFFIRWGVLFDNIGVAVLG
jgi:hypothetical protein